jgi:hypothetical protein
MPLPQKLARLVDVGDGEVLAEGAEHRVGPGLDAEAGFHETAPPHEIDEFGIEVPGVHAHGGHAQAQIARDDGPQHRLGVVQRKVERAVDDFHVANPRGADVSLEFFGDSLGVAEAIDTALEPVVGAITARQRAPALGLDLQRRGIETIGSQVDVAMRIGRGQTIEVVNKNRRICLAGAVGVAADESRHALQRLPGTVAGGKLDHRGLAVALDGVGEIQIGEQFRSVDPGRGAADDDRTAEGALAGFDHLAPDPGDQEAGPVTGPGVDVSDGDTHDVRPEAGDGTPHCARGRQGETQIENLDPVSCGLKSRRHCAHADRDHRDRVPESVGVDQEYVHLCARTCLTAGIPPQYPARC